MSVDSITNLKRRIKERLVQPSIAVSPSTSSLTEKRPRHYHYSGPPPIESRSAIISGERCSVAALRFSRRCWTEDVPGISRMFGER